RLSIECQASDRERLAVQDIPVVVGLATRGRAREGYNQPKILPHLPHSLSLIEVLPGEAQASTVRALEYSRHRPRLSVDAPGQHAGFLHERGLGQPYTGARVPVPERHELPVAYERLSGGEKVGCRSDLEPLS